MDANAVDLEFCRLVGRVHAAARARKDLKGLEPIPGSDVYQSFKGIEPYVKLAFESNNISMSISLVHSQFDDEIAYRPHVIFRDLTSTLVIPDSALIFLHEFVERSHTAPRIPYLPQTLCFGFLGRTIEANGKTFVTDGLQSFEDQAISLDYTVHSVSTHDELLHRIMHELLHVCGIEEDEMPKWTLPSIYTCRLVFDAFVDGVHDVLRIAYPQFVSRVRQIAEEHQELLSELRYLADRLYRDKLFPAPSSETVYTEMFYPKSFQVNGNVEVGSSRVIFL